MGKLGKTLKISDDIRVKTFEYRNHTFKVRVPLSKEMDDIYKRVANLDEGKVKLRLEKMTSALRDTNIEGIEVIGDDVVVDGRSTKETVSSVIQMEQRIVEYMKLLVPDSGSLDDLSYEDIEEEFPLQIQFEMLEKIMEVIQPGYKDAKKN